MSEQEEIKLYDRIKANVRQTQKTLFERKAKLGEMVAIADSNGKSIVVSAEDALMRLKSIDKQ